MRKLARMNDAERLRLVRQFMQQKDAMARLNLDQTCYVAYKIGYSLGAAERDIDLVKDGAHPRCPE